MTATAPGQRLEFDQQRADEIYLEMENLQIDLDPDPLSYGPKRLNEKIAQCRSHLSRCERIYTQLSQTLHRAKKAHLALSADLSIQMDDMFANDPEVRAGRNVSDREAIAKTKLSGEVREQARLDGLVQDLDMILSVVRAKRADLRDTLGRMRDQIRLCQEEIGLGSHWGSKGAQSGTRLNAGLGRDFVDAAKRVDDLIADLGPADIHLPAIPASAEEAEEAEVLAAAEAEAGLVSKDFAFPPQGNVETDLSSVLAASASTAEIDSFLNVGADLPLPRADEPKWGDDLINDLLADLN